MTQRVVSVGEFPNAALAEMARGYLAERGIPAEVSGALAQSWAGGEVPLAGVRLEVRREDAAEARRLLSEVELRVAQAGRARSDLVEPFEGDTQDEDGAQDDEHDEEHDEEHAQEHDEEPADEAEREDAGDAVATPSRAEEDAQRIWRGGFLGLLLPPLAFYILAKFLLLALRGDLFRLPAALGLRAWVGGLLALATIVVPLLLFWPALLPIFI